MGRGAEHVERNAREAIFLEQFVARQERGDQVFLPNRTSIKTGKYTG
jgi:hypothetical protein